MMRPKMENGDSAVDYVFKLNVYVNELEKAAKTLRRGIMYAQDIIETDIPPFGQMLKDTAWIEGAEK